MCQTCATVTLEGLFFDRNNIRVLGRILQLNPYADHLRVSLVQEKITRVVVVNVPEVSHRETDEAQAMMVMGVLKNAWFKYKSVEI